MRKRLTILAVIVAVFLPSVPASAESWNEPKGINEKYDTMTEYEIECTGYYETGLTASGYEIKENDSRQIAAFSPDMIGFTALVEMPNGEYRYYEVVDTGAVWSGVRTGEVLDLHFNSREECLEFGRQKLKVIFYDAKG